VTALLIEPSAAALVLIDLQAGIMGVEATPRTVKDTLATCIRLAEACRKSGVKVFLVRVDIGDMQNIVADRPSRAAGAPKPPPSASVLVPEIGPAEGDIVITKKQWGAFYGTELDLQLRRRGLRTVILGGVATNFGVESTARDGMELGYELVFAEDAMTSIGEGAHQFAIETIFPRMGRVRSTDEIIAGLHA
jgi:nicotinamidase-related amidase